MCLLLVGQSCIFFICKKSDRPLVSGRSDIINGASNGVPAQEFFKEEIPPQTIEQEDLQVAPLIGSKISDVSGQIVPQIRHVHERLAALEEFWGEKPCDIPEIFSQRDRTGKVVKSLTGDEKWLKLKDVMINFRHVCLRLHLLELLLCQAMSSDNDSLHITYREMIMDCRSAVQSLDQKQSKEASSAGQKKEKGLLTICWVFTKE